MYQDLDIELLGNAKHYINITTKNSMLLKPPLSSYTSNLLSIELKRCMNLVLKTFKSFFSDFIVIITAN